MKNCRRSGKNEIEKKTRIESRWRLGARKNSVSNMEKKKKKKTKARQCVYSLICSAPNCSRSKPIIMAVNGSR